jgi:hypothetical protein
VPKVVGACPASGIALHQPSTRRRAPCATLGSTTAPSNTTVPDSAVVICSTQSAPIGAQLLDDPGWALSATDAGGSSTRPWGSGTDHPRPTLGLHPDQIVGLTDVFGGLDSHVVNRTTVSQLCIALGIS